ncbi:MAG: DUF2169 domain-containing protein [Myxococcota bacterium]
MWAVVNESPFEVDRTWVRDVDGRHQFIVAVRATYEVDAQGRLRVAETQLPPALEPDYQGEDGASSLRWDLELGPLKPSTDVVVNGHAYAPNRPVEEVAVSLRIDDQQKVLNVRGENVYYAGVAGLTTTTPRPFERMPIVYERAFGGHDTTDPDQSKHRLDPRNPVGVGFATRSAHLVDTPAPNILYPGQNASKVGPAGFGALCSFWSPRLELGGTYDARWVETRKPLLPEDYDPRATLCSPRDQQPGRYLGGGTRFELVHLTPDRHLSFELPPTTISTTSFFGSKARPAPARVTTVIIEPDDRRVLVVWQSSLPVAAADLDYLDVVNVEARNPE